MIECLLGKVEGLWRLLSSKPIRGMLTAFNFAFQHDCLPFCKLWSDTCLVSLLVHAQYANIHNWVEALPPIDPQNFVVLGLFVFLWEQTKQGIRDLPVLSKTMAKSKTKVACEYQYLPVADYLKCTILVLEVKDW